MKYTDKNGVEHDWFFGHRSRYKGLTLIDLSWIPQTIVGLIVVAAMFGAVAFLSWLFR